MYMSYVSMYMYTCHVRVLTHIIQHRKDSALFSPTGKTGVKNVQVHVQYINSVPVHPQGAARSSFPLAPGFILPGGRDGVDWYWCTYLRGNVRTTALGM